MTVIKNNYLFPIYCPDAELIDGERNFYATGQDIIDTMGDADVYVQKSGDEMTGPLVFKHDINIDASEPRTQFSIRPNSSGFDTAFYIHNSGTLRLRSTASDDTSGFTTHIQINRATHNVGSTPVSPKTHVDFLRTPTDIHHAANKYYVDFTSEELKIDLEQQIGDLTDDVVDLAQELNAISASIVRGKWMYQESGTVPDEGNYLMVTENGDPTNDFRNAAVIKINQKDSEAGEHTFDDASVDEYLQILDQDDEAYGLYQLQEIDDFNNGGNVYYELKVTVDQTFPDHTAKALAKIKIFEVPVLDPSELVSKNGDVMYGLLTFGTTDINDNHYGHFRVRSKGANENLFTVQADNSGAGGAASYYGDISLPNHIITKKYYEENFETGPQGDKGDAATIQVGNVKKVAPDKGAKVENKGTEYAAIFDFEIPQGVKGDQGETGTEVILHTENNPPNASEMDRGALVLTKSNKFYIYF